MGLRKLNCIRVIALTGMCLCALATPTASRADGITFQLQSTTQTITGGDTVTFDGAVTNDSGGALNASDFFFNFSGFDFASVTPTQDLGVASDFAIPNGTTSTVVALFDVALGTTAGTSSFPILVQLEDINGDLSAIETATITNGSGGGGAPVPEPASLLLFGTGLVTLGALRRRSPPNSGVYARKLHENHNRLGLNASEIENSYAR
jgi:hypothetical protein